MGLTGQHLLDKYAVMVGISTVEDSEVFLGDNCGRSVGSPLSSSSLKERLQGHKGEVGRQGLLS